MSGLFIFAWIVLIVLIIAVVTGWIVLAMLPGKIARQRGHPQADAVNVAGWLGALALGIFWPLALVWAYYKTSADKTAGPGTDSDVADLVKRVDDLETAVSAAGRSAQ